MGLWRSGECEAIEGEHLLLTVGGASASSLADSPVPSSLSSMLASLTLVTCRLFLMATPWREN